MLTELGESLRSTRTELITALDNHEKKEFAEIEGIRADIKELNIWKWRMIIALTMLLALGLVQFDNTSFANTLATLLG